LRIAGPTVAYAGEEAATDGTGLTTVNETIPTPCGVVTVTASSVALMTDI